MGIFFEVPQKAEKSQKLINLLKNCTINVNILKFLKFFNFIFFSMIVSLEPERKNFKPKLHLLEHRYRSVILTLRGNA